MLDHPSNPIRIDDICFRARYARIIYACNDVGVFLHADDGRRRVARDVADKLKFVRGLSMKHPYG